MKFKELFEDKNQLDWCEWNNGEIQPKGLIWRRMNHKGHRFYFARDGKKVVTAAGITTCLDHSFGEPIGIRKWKDDNPNWKEELRTRADYGTLCHYGYAEFIKHGKIPQYLIDIADETFDKKMQFKRDMISLKKFIKDYNVKFLFLEGILAKKYTLPNKKKSYICTAIDSFVQLDIPEKEKVEVEDGEYKIGQKKGQMKYKIETVTTVKTYYSILDLKSNFNEDTSKSFYSSHKGQLIFGRDLIKEYLGIKEEIKMFNISPLGWRTEPKYQLTEHEIKKNDYGYSDDKLMYNRLKTAIMEGAVQPKGEIFEAADEITLESENDFAFKTYEQVAEELLKEAEEKEKFNNL
jgi:hypothetical protein